MNTYWFIGSQPETLSRLKYFRIEFKKIGLHKILVSMLSHKEGFIKKNTKNMKILQTNISFNP